jgi:glycosyltransferase involved in cell wall biosynthesis
VRTGTVGSDPAVLSVLFDYRPARFGRGGIAVYAEELARALRTAYPADRLLLYSERFRRGGGERPLERLPGALEHGRRVPTLVQGAAQRLGLGLERRLGPVDLVHWTDYVAPPPLRAPLVATIHDVLFESLPDCYTARMRQGLRATTLRLVRRAAHVIVPSRGARADLVAWYGVQPDRVEVVEHGVRRLPAGEPVRGYGRYVLFAGTLEPRKNLERLLEAFERVRRQDPSLRLVVAGPRGWRDEVLVERLRRASGVTWEGRVGRDRLAALYRGALVLAYPSLGEGYGLPVLEALSVGCPVVVGAGTTPAEVMGDAGLAADPRDVSALAQALERVTQDPALREVLALRGPARAATRTWEAAARATHRVYERVLRR